MTVKEAIDGIDLDAVPPGIRQMIDYCSERPINKVPAALARFIDHLRIDAGKPSVGK